MNRFEIVKDIDEGAFGVVQMARNKDTGEIVAIKKIKKKYNSWDECMNLREIKSLKKLKHPNVIRLKEVFKLEQELFLVFEYARTNLFKLYNDEYKERGLAMPEHLIKSIIYQAVSALVYIHKMGFFHRDMKPENLLMNDRQVLKIADFGLAREIRSSPPYTEYVSTRWYRSPEILLKSTNYNSPVDIWALGCIMAELYLNGPLFNGASEMDQMAKISAVLGHPGKAWPEGVKLAGQCGFSFPSNSPQNLEDILKNASPLAVDMIRSMLNYDSSKRPTAAKLLQHPYFSQQHNASITEIPPSVPVTAQSPHPNRTHPFDAKGSHPLNCLSTAQIANQQNAVPNFPHHVPTSHSNTKQSQPVRNLLSELESNRWEHSLSSKKFQPKLPQSPLPKPPSGSPADTKGNIFGAHLDYEESQFQRKLDSMFPGTLSDSGQKSLAQNQFLNAKKSCGRDDVGDRANCTAKKKQLDADLEELEKQILATKKKYNSPGKSGKHKMAADKPVVTFEESALSRKKAVFCNPVNNENVAKVPPPKSGVGMFSDQLEELLSREQRILEQRSMKAIEGRLGEGVYAKHNTLRTKNSVCDGVGGADSLPSSESSKRRHNSIHRNLAENSLGDLENLPKPLFMVNGFQPSRVGIDALKTQHCVAQKY